MEWEIRDPTAEELEGFKECFTFLDKNKDGKVQASEVGYMLRAVGKAPTDDEVVDLLKGLGRENPETVDFDEFVSMAKQARPLPTTEELTASLGGLLDMHGTGQVAADDLRELMSKLMKTESVNEVLTEAGIPLEGNFDYKRFVRVMNGEEEPGPPHPDNDADLEQAPNGDDEDV